MEDAWRVDHEIFMKTSILILALWMDDFGRELVSCTDVPQSGFFFQVGDFRSSFAA